MSKFNCTATDITVMNLQPQKPVLTLTAGEKKGKNPRPPNFHRSAPNLSDTKLTNEETKVPKEGGKSFTFYATEAQSMNNLALKQLVKLAPLEIPLEVKEAQLKKIMSLQRDAQLAAFKLTNEPHTKRVKNVTQAEMENLHKVKTVEKSTLEYQESIHSSSVSKPLCEIQIILPIEENGKPVKNSPMLYRKPLVRQNVCENLETSDPQEDVKIPENPSQETGRHRFRLKQVKEQQDHLGKNKPLKAIGTGLEDGKKKTPSQRAHKTLTDATKLIDTVAKKHRGQAGEQDEIEEDILVGRPSSRRMALGNIILVDEE
ncbi:hypothetical protein JD844_015563 [Phrynosoma platyrhinos]|uniref:Uncharacterized protein n=1 Tax=Phrynosoma platyrhinos TaxID=52577 RepID=A0ABQ7SJ76_PHRPL|nr:hypothetical protein JD844_015563 [Phrynosoma platyrhinos]